MIVVGIDPSPVGGSWAAYCVERARVMDCGTEDGGAPPELLDWIAHADACVVERLRSYLMRVGGTVFDTQWRAGRIYEWLPEGRRHWLTRTTVKLELLGKAAGSDADVRGALIEMHGGERRIAVGLKASPGPLYGVKKDEWQALAVAIAWQRRYARGEIENA